jgi:hypothetical protein
MYETQVGQLWCPCLQKFVYIFVCGVCQATIWLFEEVSRMHSRGEEHAGWYKLTRVVNDYDLFDYLSLREGIEIEQCIETVFDPATQILDKMNF